MNAHKKLPGFLISLLIAIVISFLVFILAYNLACLISPPYIIGDNGEKLGLMPIGQVMIAGLLSGIIGILSLILGYKKIVKVKKG